jgi:tetratricopeptide (TPR) repeat protein
MSIQKHLGEAMRLLMEGAFLRTAEAADAILAEKPDDPHALLLQALAVASMGEAERAAPLLLSIAAAHPTAEHPCVEFSRLTPEPPPGVVERQFRACLALAPDDGRLRTAFGAFLLNCDAAAEAETLLSGLPNTGVVHHLRGHAFGEMGHFAAAVDEFQQATVLMPQAAASWSNYGTMLQVEGRIADAIVAHDRAIALAPNDPTLRVNRAVTHLYAGLWTRAWDDYEARLDVPGAPAFDKARLLPPLQPSDDLHGLTIVAAHEDGFGDTLHFCRYIPLLAERGARVVAAVPPTLVRLMRAVPGVAEVITGATPVPPYHYVCPMFSLPGVFRSTPESVPPVPTIEVEAALVERWRHRLPQGPQLKVGIVWAGQARPTAPGFGGLDRRRSIGLAAVAPLFDVPDLWFISLQAGAPAEEPRPDNLTLFDPMTLVEDFADTAAIIANLDVVVSVDTSVVHLAGLMGKPVLMLDRYDNCWRWLRGKTDSIWYPKLQIFRQRRPHDWSAPLDGVVAVLHAMRADRAANRLEAPHIAA